MSVLINPENALTPATLPHTKATHQPKQQEGNSALSYLAVLGGLGLLAHVCELGEHLAESSHKRVGHEIAKALDPRHRTDPRKRLIPR